MIFIIVGQNKTPDNEHGQVKQWSEINCMRIIIEVDFMIQADSSGSKQNALCGLSQWLTRKKLSIEWENLVCFYEHNTRTYFML